MLRKILKLAIPTAIVLIIAAVGIYMLRNKTYKGIKSKKELETNLSGQTSYVGFSNGYIKLGRDGAEYIDSTKESQWTEAYSIDSPRVKTCKDKAIIADLKGTDIYIFNTKGKISNIKTEYPIIAVDIAETGVVAVVTEDELKNHIILYDSKGMLLATVTTSMEEHGFPLAIALSPDGSKIATSYLHLVGTSEESILSFFRFDDVGKNFTDRFLGSFKHPKTIIPTINFLDNDTFVAYKDNGLTTYDLNYIPKQIAEKNYDEQITQIADSSSYIGVIVKDTEEQGAYLLKLLKSDLSEKVSISIEQEVKDMVIADDEIIVNTGLGWEIYSTGGVNKFSTTAEAYINKILPIKKGTYILFQTARIEKITLR